MHYQGTLPLVREDALHRNKGGLEAEEARSFMRLHPGCRKDH